MHAVLLRTISMLGGLALALAGCALSGCTTTEGPRSDRAEDRHRITAEQMERVGTRYQTAYDVVQALRPLWLRKRGRTSFTQEGDIALYVDGTRTGTPQDLRAISVIDVQSMRFLPPAAATNRYGTGHTHGAILVKTKR